MSAIKQWIAEVTAAIETSAMEDRTVDLRVPHAYADDPFDDLVFWQQYIESVAADNWGLEEVESDTATHCVQWYADGRPEDVYHDVWAVTGPAWRIHLRIGGEA